MKEPSDQADPACIANIGPQARKKRLIFGVVLLGTSVVIAAVLVAVGVHRLWRLALSLPLWAAAVGYFQAREKT